MRLVAWWRELARRERWLLAMAAAALTLGAGFLMLEPIVDRYAWLSEEVSRMQADLAWLRAHSAEAKRLGDGTVAGAGALELSAVTVEAALRRTGLQERVSGMQPGGTQGDIAITFAAVPYAPLLDFLVNLTVDGGIRIGAMTVERLPDQPGLVRADLRLSPGTGR